MIISIIIGAFLGGIAATIIIKLVVYLIDRKKLRDQFKLK